VDRAGLVGADGETHHGCFDVPYLSTVPGMTVLCPASLAELRGMLRRAVEKIDGPVAVRYPRGGEGRYRGCCGEEVWTDLRDGEDCTIVTYGTLVNQALDAAEALEERGIRAGVVKLNQIVPLPAEEICAALGENRRILVLEDCVNTNCVGQRIGAMLAQRGNCPRLILRNVGDRFVTQGSVDQLYQDLGLDAAGVAKAVEEALREQ
jgi:1-deoxy-D-xylulose-5-phosphate synthase